MIFNSKTISVAFAIAILANITQANIWSIDLVPLDPVDEILTHLNYVFTLDESYPGGFLVILGTEPQFIIYDDISHRIYTTLNDTDLHYYMNIDALVVGLFSEEGVYASFDENDHLILDSIRQFYACLDFQGSLSVQAYQTSNCHIMNISLASSSSIPSPTPNHISTHYPVPTTLPGNVSDSSTTSVPISHLSGTGVRDSPSYGIFVAGLAAFVLILM